MPNYFSFLNGLGTQPGQGGSLPIDLQIADIEGLADALTLKLTASELKSVNGQPLTGGGNITVSGTWDGLTGKPDTFAPSAHNQAISTITGLQTALDARPTDFKTINGAAITGAGDIVITSGVSAWGDITGKPTTFAPNAHDQAISTITGLQAALNTLSDRITALEAGTPVVPITTNTGTVSNYADNGTAADTFTISGASIAGHNGNFSIPQAVIDSGYGHQIVAPTFTTNTSGAQPVWSPGDDPLIAWPSDDIGDMLISVRVSGVEVATSLPYTRLAVDAVKKHELVVILANNKSQADEVVVEFATELQPEVPYIYAPAQFRSANSSLITWDTPAGFGSVSRAVWFVQFAMKPDVGDTNWEGSIFSIYQGTQGDTGVISNGTTTRRVRFTLQKAPLLYKELLYAQDDLISLIMVKSPVAAENKIMRRINGGAWLTDAITPVAAMDLTAATQIRMGSRNYPGGPADGVSHDEYRAALWFGNSFDPAENVDKFLTADGLEHPDVSWAVLGTPIIDWRSDATGTTFQNYGSLGAPTSRVGV